MRAVGRVGSGLVAAVPYNPVMIARLRGKLVEKAADRVVIDAGGVGYEVMIPFSTYYELGEVGDEAAMRIYTHVKEDSLSLFGFLSGEEKKLFTLLIQVSGIGPKLGIAILSGLPPEEFVQAVQRNDLRRLNAIPGVGKKTAERLVLEMRDKLSGWASGGPESQPVAAQGTIQSDVVSALVNLGYSKVEAEKRLSKARNKADSDRFEDLLRAALS